MSDNFILGISLFIILFISNLIISFIKFYRSYKRVKRFYGYSYEIENNDKSLNDNIIYLYSSLESKLSSKLIKLHIFDTYSRKYYNYSKSLKISDNMSYISRKIFLGCLFVFIFVLSSLFRIERLSIYYIVFTFLIGFFIYDIYLSIIRKRNNSRISDDMSTAIVIMNNAFKSGFSIVQAIDMVCDTLDGPIKDEFMHMKLDLSYGLELESVFKRFSERVPCTESIYLASILTVLNETGGDIVTIFDSIEENSLLRKKLRDELSSTSSQSRLVFKLLVVIPPILVLSILVLSPGYFSVFFTTMIGFFIFLLIVFIYIIYIIIIRKIVYIEVKL